MASFLTSCVISSQVDACPVNLFEDFEYVRQAWETSPKKSRPGNHWQWYTHGLLVRWCRIWVVVKSQPCHCVCGSQLLSNLVTILHAHVAACLLFVLYVVACTLLQCWRMGFPKHWSWNYLSINQSTSLITHPTFYSSSAWLVATGSSFISVHDSYHTYRV